MSETPRASFRAKVTLSARSQDGLLPAKVRLTDDKVMFITEHTETPVTLSDVVDIAQDVPAAASPDAVATIRIEYEHARSYATVDIKARAKQLVKFQVLLFKLLLDDAPVAVRQSGDGADIDEPIDPAFLDIRATKINFESEDGVLSLPRSSIMGFNAAKRDSGTKNSEPAVAIYSYQDGKVKTDVCLPSFRFLNIFGRFLQTSPDAGRKSSAEPKPSDINVLVVDDDVHDREMTKSHLDRRDDKLQIITATGAADAMETLESEPVDCIVSDYEMPGTNGIEFLQQVRAQNAELPFILFTGQGSGNIAKQALLSDVNDYVEKGIGQKQYDILAQHIQKALTDSSETA